MLMRPVFFFLAVCLPLAVGSDIDALLQFIKGVRHGPSAQAAGFWNAATSPDASGCPLDWNGVRCSDGQVLSIALDGAGLAGNASLSLLAGMSALQNLSLSGNRLEGVIPAELGSLRSLERLDLSGNLFSGELPAQLMKLSNLVHLNMSFNSFTGALPLELRFLKKLKHLDLRGNQLSGRLDDILMQLQSPVYVDFSCNQFTGTLMSITDNSSVASSLQYLNVSHNSLSGMLFGDGDPMPLLDKLEVFDASFNTMNGNVPSFNFMVSLRILRLASNNFSGKIPEELFQETSMIVEEMDLSCNQLTGPLGRVGSTTLRYFNLSFNALSGNLPITMGSSAVVDLSSNSLSGGLAAIRAWGNSVEFIDLSSNQLTGTLPNETSQFLMLKTLKASKNQLEGELPAVIGTYPALSTLDLSVNQLYGSLPPTIFSSAKLRNLNLSSNRFTGAVPFAASQQSSNLLLLDLSSNSFNGSIPLEIREMTELVLLDLSNNNISGQIPKEVAALGNLHYIDLSRNHLGGSIPTGLPDALVRFNVSYNDLSGAVPDSLLKFPDSAFHPGNELLELHHLPDQLDTSHGSSNGVRHGIGRPLMYALIALAAACAAGIVVLLVVRRVLSSTRSRAQDDVHQSKSAESPRSNQEAHRPSAGAPPILMHINPLSKETEVDQEPPAAALPFDQPNSEGDFEAPQETPPILCDPQLLQPEHQTALRVCSPDKLLGDLHVFDNALAFTAEELSHAPAEILGRSCHGTSYKATLGGGHVLTVKWLKEGFAKSKKEFSREVKKLGDIRHPNLVPLRGFYIGPKEHERIILSDYVEATSLAAFLTDQGGLLSLRDRLAVAVDVARCLTYLHNERAIPHGNLKSSNVLIGGSPAAAQLTDYSLHRLMTPAGMAEQVLNAGALGYSPPEFGSTNKPCPSLKSDVYAFGVVLLELLTGKNAGEIVYANEGVVDLIDWVRQMVHEGRGEECLDRHIIEDSNFSHPQQVHDDMLGIALRCIRAAADRPEMRAVFQDLSAISN